MNAATHHGYIQEALKMNGAFVKITPLDFQNILQKEEGLVVVFSKSGIFSDEFIYLTSYKGFIFYCKSKEQLTLPNNHQLIFSSKVSLPVM